MTLKSTNPFTGILIEEFEEFSDKILGIKISQSAEAFEKWKYTPFHYRKKVMTAAAALLRKNLLKYAEAITMEMGKPIRESRAEIEKCAWVCEYYAENAYSFLMPEPVPTDGKASYVHFEPLGTIFGIMPWNFPFWQVFRFAVPTLMAGNTVMLKHASNVQRCAGYIESIFNESGFPKGVFMNLVVGSDKVDMLIGNDIIKAVSLTGSESAGEKVAEGAGKRIKKAVLELGGSNAFVVLEDANLKNAVETGLISRMQNAGQSCIAAKRFIIHEKISEKFIALFLEKVSALQMGDPGKETTDIGPLANLKQVESLDAQVKKSVAMGARILAGGLPQGAFYPPTLLVNVRPGMPVFDEEVFGPVAPVIIAKDADEAVHLANQTKFGLGVTLFTNDLQKAREMVPEFKDGAVFINAMVKSDPRLPFGGTKKSGYGRELAKAGIREFVNIKTVFINYFREG